MKAAHLTFFLELIAAALFLMLAIKAGLLGQWVWSFFNAFLTVIWCANAAIEGME